MIRKLLVVAAAVAMPVSLVGISGMAGAAKGPSAATDTAVCTGLTGTVSFSIPLTNHGSTSGTEVTTVSGHLTGCTASGSFAVNLPSSGSFPFSATLTGKPGSAKKPTATCGGLNGPTKQKGNLVTTWTGSTPAIAPTTIGLKSTTGGVGSDGHGTFTVQGKYKGSFGGSDKGATSSTAAETVDTITTIVGECGTTGVSSLGIQTEPGVNPAVLK